MGLQAKFDEALKAGEPVEFLKNEKVAAMIEAGGVYQKSAKTALRRPAPDEVGTTLRTMVKDGDGVREEIADTVGADKVIARNPGAIGADAGGSPIFNEWLIPMDVAVKNYGKAVVDGLGTEFTEHRKAATIKAVELTGEVMEALGVEGDTLKIKVDWSPEPMTAKVGDYLASGGYSISAHDMGGYVPVEQAPAPARKLSA